MKDSTDSSVGNTPKPPEEAAHSERTGKWRERLKGRCGLALCLFVSLMVLYTLIRTVLIAAFRENLHASWGQIIEGWFRGLHRDFLVALLYTLPLLGWFALMKERWLHKRWGRAVLWGGLWFLWMLQIFLAAAEYYFFDEFQSRFNTVAVDYLIYPHEVFINIWDSYPVVWIILLCAALAGAWVWIARRSFPAASTERVSAGARWGIFLGACALAGLWSLSVPLKRPDFCHERALNEIADNGAISCVAAAWTRDLDYAAFYKTIDLNEAYRRVRRMIEEPGMRFAEEGRSVTRIMEGDPSKPRLNVVILLEESLGSSFWGVLGAKPSLTPEMDRVANEQGWLFTNIYATGNRTVRGMEGVLSGFPPLPGDSIVWRDMSKNVETLARVLKRDGYRTEFIYAGRGLFDRMKGFSLRNGFDRFIEEKDIENPIFKTIWGVCDEDLYRKAIEEFRALHATGDPFFSMVLTVSNHKPYTYPKGRIAEDPDARKRRHAVKYADYALGWFFRQVRKEPFWKDTIFVVVADHGARVYGSPTVPIHSYEIPFLIVGPAVVDRPRRFDILGCQMDIPVTLLSLIGRTYKIMFLGRNLLNLPPERGRAFLNHNRDIAMFAKDRLIVLGLGKTAEYYRGNPKREELIEMDKPTPFEEELERDAIAMFQVADDLYIHRRFHLDPNPEPK